MIFNRCINCESEIESYPCPHCGFDRSAYQQPEYALPCDTVLHGRYLIGKVLGQGGFGITYVGWDLALEIKVAIKEYYPNGQVARSASGMALNWYTNAQSKALRQNGMATFSREARKMAKVERIPEVVRVRDTFAENETAYIVMDFVEGETLKEHLLKTGVLSWEDAQKIFFPVVSAMERVHKAGLIHRDLSPDNLMLTPEGDVYILDLGAAKDLSANSGLSSMQVAKNGFSPLEQYTQRGGTGSWSDVYAMAATMYYSLTGVLPPTAIDRLEEDTIDWNLPQLGALPVKALDALKKAMTVLAKERTQTMGELLEQLNVVPAEKKPENPKKQLKAQKQKQYGEQKKKREPGKKKLHWIPITAVLISICVVSVVLLFSNKETPEAPQLAASTEFTVEVTETSAPAPSTSLTDASEWRNIKALAAGSKHIVGLKPDGTVVAAGDNTFAQCDVNTWTDIVALAAGRKCTLGLKSDGTVLVATKSEDIQNEVAKWKDIKAIYANDATVVGMHLDGTISFNGTNLSTEDSVRAREYKDVSSVAIIALGGQYYQTHYRTYNRGNSPNIVCLHNDGRVEGAIYDGSSTMDKNYNWHYFESWFAFEDWTQIRSIDAGAHHILGLRENGTVIARNVYDRDEYGECAVSNWKNITDISAGFMHSVGLKSDGTVVATGQNDNGQCDVSSWKNIIAIDAGVNYTVGLKKDGTVVIAGA